MIENMLDYNYLYEMISIISLYVYNDLYLYNTKL